MPTLREMLRDRLRRDSLYCTPGYWDAKAETCKGLAVSMWPNNHLNSYYHAEDIRNIGRCLKDIQGAKILDVGCGTGRLSRYLAQRGAHIVGMDFSPRSIDLARELTSGNNPSFRVQSVFDLEDSDAYDIVISWASLTVACRNREDLLKAMKLLFTALMNNGRILLIEPVHKGFLHRVLNMDIREFCAVMAEAGFRVREIRHLHCWPVRLALAFIGWPKFVTAVGYYLGEALLMLTRHRALGDYHSVLAVKESL